MKYYIAIDTGGSKTDSVLVEQTGNVLARVYGRGANAFDIGPTEAASRIVGTVEQLLQHLPANEKLSGVFGSVSVIHFYPEIQDKVSKRIPGVPCKLDSVVSSVMAAAIGREEGACLISGTGSYCCVREKNQPMRYFGSTGYLLDTGGSGYVLGQQALIAAQRDLDGRGRKTLLTEMIEREVGESVLDHLPVIYEGGRPYIASFAHHVFAARLQGDEVAQEIFDAGVNYYAEALEAAHRVLKRPFKVALGGGIFLHHSDYVAAVAQRAPKDCKMILIDMPAVYGSALEAVWLSGEDVPAEFRMNFSRSYARFPHQGMIW